jgi:hypothetical protein
MISKFSGCVLVLAILAAGCAPPAPAEAPTSDTAPTEAEAPAPAVPPKASEPPRELTPEEQALKLMEERIAVILKMAETLENAKDPASAEQIRPAMAEMKKQCFLAKRSFDRLPVQNREGCLKTHAEPLAEAERRLARAEKNMNNPDSRRQPN